MLKKSIIFVLVSGVLVGCATPYQPSGFSGGYTEMAYGNDIYFVAFRGNGFTSSETVQGYALRRAAELTINKGYKYFIVINGGTSVSTQVMQTPTTVQTHSNGNFYGSGFGHTSYSGNSAFSNYNYSGYGSSNSYTTINPGTQYNVNKYNSGITIKMLHNKNYPQAYDAVVILNNFQK